MCDELDESQITAMDLPMEFKVTNDKKFSVKINKFMVC